jgi:hypothetical protein
LRTTNNEGKSVLDNAYEKEYEDIIEFVEEKLDSEHQRLIALKKEKNIKPQLQTIIVSAELMFKKNQKNK